MPSDRSALLRRARRLAWLTIGWNLVEGTIGVAAALASGSVALLGFGIDSFVESTSGVIVLWRVGVEADADSAGGLGRDGGPGLGSIAERVETGEAAQRVERAERVAERLIGASLALLAAYVTFDAVTTLVSAERPTASPVGIALAAVSLVVMLWLAAAKRHVAVDLGSRALAADAVQTQACWWLSAAVLVGVGLNTVLGWWWADPVAGLAIAFLVAREALEAWRGEDEAEGGGAGGNDADGGGE